MDRGVWEGGVLAADTAGAGVRLADVRAADVPYLEVGPELVALRDAAMAVVRLDATAATPALTGEEIVHLRCTQDIISIATARRAAAFAATSEAEHQGSNSSIDWIRHQAKMSAIAAAELETVGRHLNQLPASVEAVVEGRVGFSHLSLLARNAAFSGRTGRGLFDKAPLLPHAENESVGRFRHTCLHARHAQDPDGSGNAEADAFEQRELTIVPLRDEGLTWINILLDNANAAFTQAVLEKLAVRQGAADTRSKPQRMADAFLELAQAPLRELDGAEVVGRRVQLNVTCTSDSLLGLPGAPGAEIAFGSPISAAMLRRIACDAKICKILLDDNLVPVAVGTTKRQLTKRERRALNARDGHCQFPGCNRPPSFCSEHHLDEWALSHATKLSRMVLLCAFHHWRVHEGGWLLGKDGDGRVHVVPPYLRNLARGPGGGFAA